MVSTINFDTYFNEAVNYGMTTQNLTSGNNKVVAGSGNDTIMVTGTSNYISGGDGSDVFIVEGNNNTILDSGGDSDVSLSGNSNTVTTSGGNDTINVNGNHNTISSGAGNDTLTLSGHSNTFSGGAGNDTIIASGNNNFFNGNAGEDTYIISGNNTTINDGSGASKIKLEGNNSTIVTGAGNDEVIVYGDSNRIWTNAGNDKVVMLGNSNYLRTGSGDDTIGFAGQNNDIDAGSGNDTVLDLKGDREVIIDTFGRGVWGDPHYEIKGADGSTIKFDHHGTAGHTYEVFSGDNITIDGLYKEAPNAPCVIGNTTISAGDDVATFDWSGNATINGAAVSNGTYNLADGTVIKVDGKKLTVTPSDGTGSVDIYAKGGSMVVDPSGNFSNLGGILGTAIAESRTLSEAEANQFDLANGRQSSSNPFSEAELFAANMSDLLAEVDFSLL